MAKSNDELLASELAALQKHLGLLETEICAADLRLAEIESEQREILRRRARAEERARIAIAEAVSLRHRGMRHGEAREIIQQMASELFELRHRWEAIERDYLERQKAKREGDRP